MRLTLLSGIKLSAVTATLCVTGLLAAVGPASPGLAASRLRTSGVSHCASLRPYRASRSLLTACGDHIYSLQAVRPLPGGGSSYRYDVDGRSVAMLVPPAGFNPLTASAAKLAEYGFPTRPRSGQALRSWLFSMRRAHMLRPPDYLVSGPGAAAFSPDTLGKPSGLPASSCSGTPSNNPCWAGNVATGHTYTNVYADWLEPTITKADCSTPQAEGTWAGLGGVSTDPLVQAGTQDGAGGTAHQAWWELTPGAAVFEPLYATVGGEFHVNIEQTSSGYSIFLENDYTGSSLPAIKVSTGDDGSTAEFIVEDPNGGEKASSPTYLIRFGTFEVEDAEASDDGGSVFKGLASWPHTDYTMTHGSDTMAYAGSAFNSGDSWYDYHSNCD